jgi:hypothetical protein
MIYPPYECCRIRLKWRWKGPAWKVDPSGITRGRIYRLGAFRRLRTAQTASSARLIQMGHDRKRGLRGRVRELAPWPAPGSDGMASRGPGTGE